MVRWKRRCLCRWGRRQVSSPWPPEDVDSSGAQIILGNTYHLYLRPGDELIARLGGLHRFMGWSKPILTDSGGYQVSSLGNFKRASQKKLSTIDDDGVTFQSHLDGSTHRLSPEKAIEIQANLGSDIIMAFDEAAPDMGRAYTQAAMNRTHEWLKRCKKRWLELEEAKGGSGADQSLFGIIQGGLFKDLRRESAQFVIDQDLPGIAVGGGSIGQSAEITSENYGWIRDLMPRHKPVYFMGVGVRPSDIVAAIKDGADMFDCVAPTKLARTGLLYTGMLTGLDQADISQVRFESADDNERITIEKAEYAQDSRPVDERCDCYTCTKGFSRLT
jgi:queuine tRNA-ribosyltransferase